MNPEAYALQSVKWDLFTTLTLPNNLLSAGGPRLGAINFAWLRRVADFGGIHFRRLRWCLRYELGEKTNRPHFHALVGGLPESRSNKRARMAYKKIWEKLTHAHARVSRFNEGLGGLGYVLKGGATYELGKFVLSADTVTLSKSCFPLVERSNRVLTVATRSHLTGKVGVVPDPAQQRA